MKQNTKRKTQEGINKWKKPPRKKEKIRLEGLVEWSFDVPSLMVSNSSQNPQVYLIFIKKKL